MFLTNEAIKRTVYSNKDDKVTMSIPRALLDDICKKHLKEDFEAVVESSPYHDKMTLVYDKMRIVVRGCLDQDHPGF
jgi:hypothetical protein